MKETNHSNLPLQLGEMQGEIKGKYFNTTHLTGENLSKAKLQSGKQEDKMLSFFQDYPNNSFTRHEVRDYMIQQKRIHEITPESSIGRSLNTLMREHKIVKLSAMRMGKYGKPNHLWTIKKEIPQVLETPNPQLDIF